MEIYHRLDKIIRMKPTYKHSQPGTAMAMAMAICSLIVIVAYLFNRSQPIMLVAVIPFAGCAALFSLLTIQINGDCLKWSFGPGLLLKSIPLKEVVSAEPVENRWYHGWGIHYAGGEWFYNVAGFDAVRVTLKNGMSFRLGTDEPEALTAAIRDQIH